MTTTAIILAAGRGSRLYPYTENCPKCLTELGGKTLIERQIDTLKSAGIHDIVIVSGYRGEMLEFPGTRRIVNTAWETTNMVESLFEAEAEFNNDVIVAYADIIYEITVIQALLQSDKGISVIVDIDWRSYWSQRFDDPLSDAESLKLTEDGKIIDIGNTVSDISEIDAQYIGLMRFNGVGIKSLRRAKADLGRIQREWMSSRPIEKAYMTDLLMELILTNHNVHAVPIRGKWLEIDTPNDLELGSKLVGHDEDKRFCIQR